MQKSYIQVSYRDIAKMLSSALPVEGEEFGDKVNEYIGAIKRLPQEEEEDDLPPVVVPLSKLELPV